MKFRTLYTLLIVCSLGYTFMSNSGGRANAANDGNTSAPGEGGLVCGTCHTGGAFGNISEDLQIRNLSGTLVTEYIPGETYNATFTVGTTLGSPAGYGFQMTALDNSNVNSGTWQNLGSNVQTGVAGNVSNRTYIEQNGTSSSPTFTMQWVAPTASTGDITFYYSSNAVDGTGSTTNDIGGTGASLTLSEGVSCAVTASLETQSNVSCFGLADGAATASPAGGTAPYTAEWDNGETGLTAMSLSAGSHTVTVTDANNCTAIANITITEPSLLTTASTVTNETSTGAANGTINVSASGGVAPYTYAWDNGATSSSLAELSPGDYCYTVTDANGCTVIGCDEVMMFTSTKDIQELNLINLFPNPATSDVQLNLEFSTAVNLEISIVNSIGQVLTNQQENNVRTSQSVFELSNYANGIYFLKVKANDGVLIKKFVVNK